MKRPVKIIIILLVLNSLVFAAIPLIKVKNAVAQQGPDPLTFYCQLEEDYINYSVQNWQEAIAEFSASLSAGGSSGGPEGPPPEANPGALAWPVSDPVVGNKFCQYCGGGWHGGIDINFGRPETDYVYAAADGTVTRAGYVCAGPWSMLGNHVTIEHNIQGKIYTTDYYHLSSFNVHVGDYVAQNQVIGNLGNTCTATVHLHFALKKNGVTYTNPCLLLPAEPVPGWQCLTGIGCLQEPATCSGP